MTRIIMTIAACLAIISGCAADSVADGPSTSTAQDAVAYDDGSIRQSDIESLDTGKGDIQNDIGELDSIESNQTEDAVKLPPECIVDKDCDDGVSCTVGKCNSLGACVYNPDAQLCDKGNFCELYYCDVIKGCVSTSLPDGKDCGSYGCLKKTCVSKECISKIILSTCKDGDVCSQAHCNALGVCEYSIKSGCCKEDSQCEDGLYCTLNKCNKSDNTCYELLANCDDGNVCTADYCDENAPKDKKCKHVPIKDCCNSAKDCVDDSKCNVDKCVKSWHKCVYATKDCNDNKPCTKDFCDVDTGKCVNTTIKGCCTKLTDCGVTQSHDKTGCLFTLCNPTVGLAGTCTTVNAKDGSECLDGDLCNGADHCESGKCVPNKKTVVACDDGNLCTTDYCTQGANGGCKFVPVKSKTPCSDGNACTSSKCFDGFCKVWNQNLCDDGVQCTLNSCASIALPGPGGKSYKQCFLPTFVHSLCSDNKPCTVDTCTKKGCVNTPKKCDDGNSCTTDSCDKKTGTCKYTPIKDCCAKDSDCVGDKCTQVLCNKKTGKCGTTLLHYNDCMSKAPNCTTRIACHRKSGACKYDELVSGKEWVSIGVGVCVDTSPCSAQKCDPKTGKCVSKQVCDDGNKCTDDSCQGGKKCKHVPVKNCCNTAKDCDDGNPCRIYKCQKEYNHCTYVPAKNCDDGNKCSVDSCDEKTGKCKHLPFIGKGCCEKPTDCNDNNKCTIEKCENFKCSNKQKCDDHNPCTVDTCDKWDGSCSFKKTDPTCCKTGDDCKTPPNFCPSWIAVCEKSKCLYLNGKGDFCK